MVLFFKGLLIGFLLALPLGPTMVLCIRNSLLFGALTGLITGAGAGLADAIYGVLSGYGIYIIMDVIEKYHLAFHILGGIVLTTLGIKTFKEHIKIKQESSLSIKPLFTRLFFTTFTLTLTSPLTFVGVAALCASIEVFQEGQETYSPWILGAGLFLGSCIWWQILSLFFSLIKKRISHEATLWVGKVSGLFLIALSIVLIFLGFR
jgi:threonine/homoserine/homoserine lactone efflux protein